MHIVTVMSISPSVSSPKFFTGFNKIGIGEGERQCKKLSRALNFSLHQPIRYFTAISVMQQVKEQKTHFRYPISQQ
jgi:hypothetical protein